MQRRTTRKYLSAGDSTCTECGHTQRLSKNSKLRDCEFIDHHCAGPQKVHGASLARRKQKNMFFHRPTKHAKKHVLWRQPSMSLKNIRCTSPKPSEKNSLQASFCPSKPSKTRFNHGGSHQNVLFVAQKNSDCDKSFDTTTTIEPHHHEEVSDVVFSPPQALRDFFLGFDGSGMFYGP